MAVCVLNSLANVGNAGHLGEDSRSLENMLTYQAVVPCLETAMFNSMNVNNLVKSASFIIINDLMLSNGTGCKLFNDKEANTPTMFNEQAKLINDTTGLIDTGGYKNRNDQTLTINKVGSYVELRLKRLSGSKYLLNDVDHEARSFKTHRFSHPYYEENRRRNSSNMSAFAASTESISSIYKSRSRSTSRSSTSSSSSSSFFSPFSADSSFRKKKSKKKLKLSAAIGKMSSTATTTIASTANAKKLSSSSSSKKSTKKISRQRPKIASSCQSKPKKACKSSKHNKFAKLNEEFISKSYLSKSCVIASSLSNFSLANAGSQPNAKKLKCLLVGDARVGKSALMFLFLKQIFQFEYQPTIVDDYEGNFCLFPSFCLQQTKRNNSPPGWF